MPTFTCGLVRSYVSLAISRFSDIPRTGVNGQDSAPGFGADNLPRLERPGRGQPGFSRKWRLERKSFQGQKSTAVHTGTGQDDHPGTRNVTIAESIMSSDFRTASHDVSKAPKSHVQETATDFDETGVKYESAEHA